MVKVDFVAEPGKPEIVITSILDAPRERHRWLGQLEVVAAGEQDERGVGDALG